MKFIQLDKVKKLLYDFKFEAENCSAEVEVDEDTEMFRPDYVAGFDDGINWYRDYILAFIKSIASDLEKYLEIMDEAETELV